MKKIKCKMVFEVETEFDDDESTEETALVLMEEDLGNAQNNGKICGYVEGSLKLVKPPTFEEFNEMRNAFLNTAPFMDKLKLYNHMFCDVYNSISSDLSLEEIVDNEKAIINWLINELGTYNDVKYLFQFVDSRETLDALNEIYKKAKLLEEE